MPGAVEDAHAFLKEHPETQARFDRVADVVRGFETPFGLELLSTVHWIASRTENQASDEVIAGTYVWNDRKRQFSPNQIALALEVLKTKGWLSPEVAFSE